MNTPPQSPLVIDGSQGEGGGQILRSSLALAIVTGRAFRIEKIRAGRRRPGLMRQHLTAARAAARICGGRLEGDEIGSGTLVFEPQMATAGEHTFRIGTAGSTTLVFQTVLPALLSVSGESTLRFEGGTHNPLCPPFDFLARAFAPALRAIGHQVELTLERRGFAPAGGGAFTASVEGAAHPQPFHLRERGALRRRQAEVLVNELDPAIGERELKVIQKRLGFSTNECVLNCAPGGIGPGNVGLVTLQFENVAAVFTSFGQRGVTAERIAHQVCDEVERYLTSDAPVDEHLADQLLLPLALGAGGSFRTVACTPHFTTNQAIIEQFLNIRIATEREARLAWRVTVHT